MMTIQAVTYPLSLRKLQDLRYGENPHQKAALYEINGTGFPLTILQGKELSYTNLIDLDAAWRLVTQFSQPAACVVKHTSPCGVAVDDRLVEAYVCAREADRLSAFGGIVGLNQTVDEQTAVQITSTMIECVIAPDFDDDALRVLSRKPDLRVVRCMVVPYGEVEYRSVFGCLLAQERDDVREAGTAWPTMETKVVTVRQPSDDEWRALQFAWKVCAFVKSNAVVTTSDKCTLHIGGAQPSRVASAKIATGELASDDGLTGVLHIVAASDAFFPKPDGLEVLTHLGVTAVVQPGGSKSDPEVIALADKKDMAMVFTGFRHFRH